MLLIDGDHLFVYRIGFAVENDPQGMNAAKYNIKKSLETIMTTLKDSKYIIYLSGKDNFREKLATLFPYKGRRKEKQNKPKYYEQIRQYLIDTYKTEVIDGMEADDKLGIEQMKSTVTYRDCPSSLSLEEAESCGSAYTTRTYNSVIVASDKDLDMIPGPHYNFLKKKAYMVSEFEAYRWFCVQTLTGDWECDDIPGLKGIGTKTALKLLKDCKTQDELDAVVASTYMNRSIYNSKTEYYELELKGGITYCSASIDGWMKVIDEIKQLVWIRRE